MERLSANGEGWGRWSGAGRRGRDGEQGAESEERGLRAER